MDYTPLTPRDTATASAIKGDARLLSDSSSGATTDRPSPGASDHEANKPPGCACDREAGTHCPPGYTCAHVTQGVRTTPGSRGPNARSDQTARQEWSSSTAKARRGSLVRAPEASHRRRAGAGRERCGLQRLQRVFAVRQLLAVDLGLRTGLAVFSDDGRLRRYGSQNLGSRERLRRAVGGIVTSVADVAWLVAEGDRALFRIWQRAAQRAGAQATLVAPEVWREALLLDRDRRDACSAKAAALKMAAWIIRCAAGSKPKTLRHDAAEAILIGVYWAQRLGWVNRDAFSG